jgi:hypothetical protein
MKNYILISFLTALTSLASAEEVVKTCDFVVKVPGQNQVGSTTYRIVQEGKVLSAKTTQTIDGKTSELPVETVLISEHSVRAHLTSKTPNMNQAEQLIAGTIEFLEDPELGKSFNVGVALQSIRHAKVYQIGKFTHMGGSAIIEARDENEKYLGSFVTGFMPFSCKQ